MGPGQLMLSLFLWCPWPLWLLQSVISPLQQDSPNSALHQLRVEAYLMTAMFLLTNTTEDH